MSHKFPMQQLSLALADSGMHEFLHKFVNAPSNYVVQIDEIIIYNDMQGRTFKSAKKAEAAIVEIYVRAFENISELKRYGCIDYDFNFKELIDIAEKNGRNEAYLRAHRYDLAKEIVKNLKHSGKIEIRKQ